MRIFGAFRCGARPDVKIFQSRIWHEVLDNELVTAENGYNNARCLTTRIVRVRDKKAHARIPAPHETCIERFHSFGILHRTFQNDVNLHGTVLHAIAE